MEFDRDMSILEDSMVISEYDGSYFMEAANGNKENFFKKAIRKVKEFIQKIISKLEEKFSKNKLAQKQKAFLWVYVMVSKKICSLQYLMKSKESRFTMML